MHSRAVTDTWFLQTGDIELVEVEDTDSLHIRRRRPSWSSRPVVIAGGLVVALGIGAAAVWAMAQTLLAPPQPITVVASAPVQPALAQPPPAQQPVAQQPVAQPAVAPVAAQQPAVAQPELAAAAPAQADEPQAQPHHRKHAAHKHHVAQAAAKKHKKILLASKKGSSDWVDPFAR